MTNEIDIADNMNPLWESSTQSSSVVSPHSTSFAQQQVLSPRAKSNNSSSSSIDQPQANNLDFFFSQGVEPLLPSWTLSLIANAGSTLKGNAPKSSISNGLSTVPVEQLKVSLAPIVAELRSINAEELLHLKRVQSGGAVLDTGIHVSPIHDLIQPPSTMEQGNVVRYIHLNEIPDQYSMGIFVFPPHAKIPLHDHPGMCVLSRILYGDVVRLSLDLTRETNENNSTDNIDHQKSPTSSWGRWSSSLQTFIPDHKGRSSEKHLRGSMAGIPGAKRAIRNKVDRLQAPEVTCLYPFEGNLHEFVAGPHGAAVLDVLLPPYSADIERDCTFYEIVPDKPANVSGIVPELYDTQHHSFSSEDETFPTSTTNHKSDAASRACWIVPTGQPENFHCISGRYKGLGSSS